MEQKERQKTKQLSLKLSIGSYEHLERMASEKGISKNKVVEDMLYMQRMTSRTELAVNSVQLMDAVHGLEGHCDDFLYEKVKKGGEEIMPVIVNKLGGHRNEDALGLLLNYMVNSPFYTADNCQGCMSSSVPDVIASFEFTKKLYGKEDRKQVSHMIIGVKDEEVTIDGLIEIAEAAADYFYRQGFQCFYVMHSGAMDNPGNWHIHMAVNTVNFNTGKRLYETYNVVSELRNHLAAQFNEVQWFSINDNSESWEMRFADFQ